MGFKSAVAEHILWLLVAAMILCAASSAVAIIAASTSSLVRIDVPFVGVMMQQSGSGSAGTLSQIIPEFSVGVGLFHFCSGGACYSRRDDLTLPVVSQLLDTNYSSSLLYSSDIVEKVQAIASTSFQFGFSQASVCDETSNSFAAIDGVIVAAWAVSATMNLLAAMFCAWLVVTLKQPVPSRSEVELRRHRGKEDNLRFLAGALSGTAGATAGVAFGLTLWVLLKRWGCGNTYCSFVIDPVNGLIADLSGIGAATCTFGTSFICSCIAFGLAVVVALLLVIVAWPLLRERAHSTKRFLQQLIMEPRLEVPPQPPQNIVVSPGPSAPNPEARGETTSDRRDAERNLGAQQDVEEEPESDDEFSSKSDAPARHLDVAEELSADQSAVIQVEAGDAQQHNGVFSSNLMMFTQRTVVTSSTSSSIYRITDANRQVTHATSDSSIAAQSAINEEFDARRAIELSEKSLFTAIQLLRQKDRRSNNLVVFHQCTLDWLFGPVLDVHLMETFMRQQIVQKWHAKLKKILDGQSVTVLPLPYFLGAASHYAIEPACSAVPTDSWLDAVDAEFCQSGPGRDEVDVSPVTAADVEVSSESDEESSAARTRHREDSDMWSLQQRYAVLVRRAVASSSEARQRATIGFETPVKSTSSSAFDHQFNYELSLLKASAGRSVAVSHTAWGRRTFDAGAAASGSGMFTVDSSWGAASVDDRLARLKQSTGHIKRKSTTTDATTPSSSSNKSEQPISAE